MLHPQDSSESPSAQRETRLCALLFLFWAYFCLNLVSRWLRWSLLVGHTTNGWPEPTLGTIVYQVYMACLPIAFYAWLCYVISLRFPRLLNRLTLLVAMFVLIVIVEFDMNWFIMSKMHLTLDDARVFLTGDPEDFGMETSVLLGHLRRVALHGLMLAILGLSALLVARFLVRFGVLGRLGLRRKPLGIILVMLVLADSAWIGYCSRHDTGLYNPSQWGFLAYANPARPRFLDRFWGGLFPAQPDLEQANKVLFKIQASTYPDVQPRAAASNKEPSQRRPWNVVVIAVESFNARIAGETDLPFWRELSRRSLRLERHYSTGNCTQYGLLGLLYGAPPFYYDGALGQGTSPFLDTFTARGYQSQRISCALNVFRNLENYLGKFTEPDLETWDVWDMIPAVRAGLAKPGPHFQYLFYRKTHYPYGHAPQFNRFLPEVSEDFHFQRWDAMRYRDEIINRYKNSLLELDAWLAAVVKEIDLENTILVVTGDHGEEFFETGRLGHCSFLNEPQTHVPCLISIPGRKSERLPFVTSHSDIMPSLADLLGWDRTPACFGQSIFAAEAPRSAVVAQNNHNHRPTVWAVVSEHHKTILEGRPDPHIIALFDRNDRKIPFSEDPTGWSGDFAEVRRFRGALLRAVYPALTDKGVASATE